MAAGVPVVAFGEGGALETVSIEPPRETGVLFDKVKADSIEEAAFGSRRAGKRESLRETLLGHGRRNSVISASKRGSDWRFRSELESLGLDKN